MKVLVIGNALRYQKYLPQLPFLNAFEIVYCPRDASLDVLLTQGGDADAIAVDPTVILPKDLISNMPNLKIIQSEGVGYNGIDVKQAAEHGVYVCNRKGANADAVAEQTILLILALLRHFIVGDRTVRSGGQLAMKERLMLEGIKEVSDCTIGYIGFGDIAKATALKLEAFNPKQCYFTPNRKTTAEEQHYNVTYLDLETLASTCDVIVVLCPLNAETEGLINADFFKRMRSDAYLVNTARGEIVDHKALRDALIQGEIAGAGLDTIAPIPVTSDNIIFDLPPEYADRLIVSPHIGGVTARFFKDAHRKNWQNIYMALKGQRPENIVNGL